MTSTTDSRFAAIGTLAGLAGAVVLEGDEALAAESVLRDGSLDDLHTQQGLLSALARNETPDATPSTLNQALLKGDADTLLAIARSARDEGDGDLAAHLTAVCFRLGAEVELSASDSVRDPRVGAYLLATAAHEEASRGDASDAIRMLLEASSLVAACSAPAAARYTGEAAMIEGGQAADRARLIHELEQAAESLVDRGFEELRGELHMNRAGLLQELGADRPPLLVQAVQGYQKATQALTRRTHPVPYALCHLNVAVTYLSMPMNEHASKLRGAIAVQSLREALEIFTPDEHGPLWQAATMNLANALQHLPSAHIDANITESVRLYEQLLEHRPEAGPERARVLANLGNALAHLGRLKDAKTRLAEARAIFADLGEINALQGIDEVLDEIGQVVASTAGTGEPAR